MKRIYYHFIVCLFSLPTLFSSCEQSDLDISTTNPSGISTKSATRDYKRIAFEDIADFQQFMYDTTNIVLNEKISESTYFKNAAPILKDYLRLSPLTKVYNEQGEFQIGNTIFKLGRTGYAEFLIPSTKYMEGIKIVDKETEIIAQLSNYEQNEDGLYVLGDSIYMSYTGEPMLELQNISPMALSNDARAVDYQVSVRFWSSSSFVFNGCGIEMSYKQMINGSLKDYNTNLEMLWKNVVIVHKDKSQQVQLGRFINIGSGNKIDTGSYDKKTFDEKGGFNIGKTHYVLYMGSTLTGKAKHSNGNWVYDTFTM